MTRLPPPRVALLLACASIVYGCSNLQPIHTVDRVNLERFMGDWYVIAHIPTFIEDEAYNAVESYELVGQAKVATTFTFRKAGFDGERKVYCPTGFVRDGTGNAVWGMQFIWPFKSEYRIIWLNDSYTQAIIGRRARDYVWILARRPDISEADYQRLVEFIAGQGYDVSKLRKVPHRWSGSPNLPSGLCP